MGYALHRRHREEVGHGLVACDGARNICYRCIQVVRLWHEWVESGGQIILGVEGLVVDGVLRPIYHGKRGSLELDEAARSVRVSPACAHTEGK